MSGGFDILTIPRLLANAARLYPDRVAIVDSERGRTETYRELDRRTRHLAGALRSLGVRKGDTVAYMSHDRLECVEIMYAVNLLGAIWVPQNYRFKRDDLIRQMEHCGAAVFFVDERCIGTCKEAMDRLTYVLPGRFIAMGGEQCPDGFLDFETFLDSGVDTAVEDLVEPADICGVIYTSGTTGEAKGAMHSHRSFISYAMVPVLQNILTAEDRLLNGYPMFHMGGTVFSMMCLVSGATNVILGSFEAERWLSVIDRFRISITCTVPTVLNAVTKLPPEVKARYDLGSLLRLGTSGAPFLTETQFATMELMPHVKLYSWYAATEVFLSMLLPEDHERKVRCVGPAAYGMEVRVVKDDGTEAGPGESGVIYARGISTFVGYFHNPEADASAFLDGWVTCQDIGFRDEEGFLHVVDRKKDVINSGGEKIFSPEIESLLMEIEEISEVAVIGVPDDYWGERVHAVVSLVPGASIEESQILEWCRERLAGFKRPRSVDIWNELPKSPVNKILKREIRATYWKDHTVKI